MRVKRLTLLDFAGQCRPSFALDAIPISSE